MLDALRLWAPPLLGVLAAFAFDRASARRGLRPPGFGDPLRRAPFLALLALVLAFGVFAGLATLGESGTVDFSAVDPLQLFLLHVVFLSSLAAWYALGWGGLGLPPGSHRRELAAQLGLRSGRLDVELGIGVVAGVAGWVAVLAIMVAVGLGLFALGGQEALPDAPPRRSSGSPGCRWPCASLSPSRRASSKSCSSAVSCSRVSGSPPPRRSSCSPISATTSR